MSGYPSKLRGRKAVCDRHGGYTVLVIEDEPDMRLLISMALKAAGFRVVGRGDGREALPILMEKPVDLVVTDLFMPDFDGLEVIRAIRDACDHLPILAISGGSEYITLDCLPIARLLGADRVLRKPFQLNELVQAVRALLPDCCETEAGSTSFG